MLLEEGANKEAYAPIGELSIGVVCECVLFKGRNFSKSLQNREISRI